MLHESVVKEIPLKQVVFAIQADQSSLDSSPTLKHVLQGGGLKFHSIAYELEKIDRQSTKLRLKTDFSIYSNVPFYGKFWSKKIIANFEADLLSCLKEVLEKIAKDE